MAMPGLVAVSRSIDVAALGSMAATRADGVGGALGWGRRGPVAGGGTETPCSGSCSDKCADMQ
jgi:hypothetical protein